MTENQTGGIFDESPCSPLVGPQFSEDDADFHILMTLWYTTIVFSVLAIILSLHLCYQHCQYYFKSAQQRWIVRILFMIPIYSVCSCLSFRYFWLADYFDILRDCYEAFVIFGFFALLQQYLGDDFQTQHEFLQNAHVKQRMTCPFPLNCFTFNPKGQAFLINSKIAILQYVGVRPTMTILAFIMASANVLCSKSMSPQYGAFWVTSINFVSVTVAMYALILFYLVIHHDIAKYNPFWKFVAVKFVVFFSFWQAIVIGLLDSYGVITATEDWTADNTAALIQSFLVCFEMLLAAFIHMKAFPVTEYKQPAVEGGDGKPAEMRTRVLASLQDILSPMDILNDFKEAPKAVADHRKRTKEKRTRRKMEAVDREFDDDIERSSILGNSRSAFNSLRTSRAQSREFGSADVMRMRDEEKNFALE